MATRDQQGTYGDAHIGWLFACHQLADGIEGLLLALPLESLGRQLFQGLLELLIVDDPSRLPPARHVGTMSVPLFSPPGESTNAVAAATNYAIAFLSHIWRNRGGQHLWRAIDKVCPGRTTFVIMVFP